MATKRPKAESATLLVVGLQRQLSEAQEARLAVWQTELEKNELILARRYIKRALKSDRVLIDARKTIVPDARRTIEIESGGLLEVAVRRLRERKNGEGGSR
jgi:hypothetical protein